MCSAPAEAGGFSAAALAGRLASLAGPARPLRLAVAVSGGADSAALLHAAAALAGGEAGLGLRALHVDHGLSAAAPALAAAARALAVRLGIPLTVLTVEVERDAGAGLEAAAREARYAALAAALAPGECLLCAHHREDQAETLLLQLLRGTGLRGLAAMPADAPLGEGRLLRPLLEVPRAALRAYAAQHRLPSVEDPMNADLRFDRAFLRARLWPVIGERWPEAGAALARAAGHAAAAQALLDAGSASRLAGLAVGPALSVAGLLALEPAARAEAIRFWLRGRGLPAPSAARLAQIEREVLGARAGATPLVTWPGVEVRRFAGLLYAFAPLGGAGLDGRALPAAGELALGDLGRLELAPGGAGALRLSPGEALHFGARTGGERIRLGATARRRALKDLLREAGLPPWARERALLVHGRALAAVVLPQATWIAAEYRAAEGERALALAWREAPAVLWPPPFN